jgi:hypothetical protein
VLKRIQDTLNSVPTGIDERTVEAAKQKRRSRITQIEQLTGERAFQHLCHIADPPGQRDLSGDPVAEFRTTLDRVDRALAVALVGRGYANTILTLCLSNLADPEILQQGPPTWLEDARTKT